MEFCEFCNNMYYIKEKSDQDDTQDLIYYCKNCGSEKEIKDGQYSKKILSNDCDTMQSKYLQYINPNIIYDLTIPHVNNVTCTNDSCIKKPSESNDVMYIKYDHRNIKYVYFCTYCKYFWINK